MANSDPMLDYRESCLQGGRGCTQPTARGATMGDHTTLSASGCTHIPLQVQLHGLCEATLHFYCRDLSPGFLNSHESGLQPHICLLSSPDGPARCLSPSPPEASLPAATTGSKGERVAEHQLPLCSPACWLGLTPLQPSSSLALPQ